MKFYIYPIESFQHTVHNSEWATTPLLPQYIGNKPLLNNSFHPIGNFDRFTQASPEEADYFVGVDSVGQHMARAVGTPGTVIFGSTFPVNTSYPDYFQIIEKPGIRKYSPIRLAGLDTMLANRINEKLMDFEEKIANYFNKGLIRSPIHLTYGNEDFLIKFFIL